MVPVNEPNSTSVRIGAEQLSTGQLGTEQLNTGQLGTGQLGTVIAVQANYYQVQLDHHAVQANSQASQRLLLCTSRSRLKKLGQRIMVGDRVQVQEPEGAGQRGAIVEVLARHSQLDRPPVANANQILLLFAVAEPKLDPQQLSRFLVKAESTGLGVQLGLNKCDLISATEQQAWHDRLSHWGYPPLRLSLYQSQGLAALMSQLRDKVTIICGPSGVGKSSLINSLIPDLGLRVGSVSGKLGRGRHTTRHVELFSLPQGGLLADSPGFNQPTLRCNPLDLPHYFPEISQRLAQQPCQFNNCSHQEELGCQVRGDWERYPYYLDLLQEVQAQYQQQEQQRDPEAVLKRKVGQAGQVEYEPRLAQKKYRQQSRRSQRQSLHHLTGSSADWLEQELPEE